MTGAKGQPVQVDQDVDFVGADAARRLLVAHGVNADIVVHCADHARAQRRTVVGTPAETVDFDLAAVVQRIQFGGQHRDRMVAVIRGQLADAQTWVVVAVGRRQRRLQRQHLLADVALRGPQMYRRIVRFGQLGER